MTDDLKRKIAALKATAAANAAAAAEIRKLSDADRAARALKLHNANALLARHIALTTPSEEDVKAAKASWFETQAALKRLAHR